MSMNEPRHYLSMRLESELFGINIKSVLEVIEYQYITRVPHMPKFIKGIINFRGEILPVVEARSKFNMQERDLGAKYVIAVIDIGTDGQSALFGLMVDSVEDVLEIHPQQIQDIHDVRTNYSTEFLAGKVKQEIGFLMLLNIEKVFSIGEYNSIQTVHQL